MDAAIGRVLDTLEASGQADDTIIIFCSDNGGERYSFQWPFVGEKGDVQEGGIRVPFIFRWPAAIDGGQVSDSPSMRDACPPWVNATLAVERRASIWRASLDRVAAKCWSTPPTPCFWRG